MSQLAVASRKQTTERQNWTELTPQALYDKCQALAKNLWWSWHPEVINLFRDLDPIRWRKFDHNPIALLAEFTPDRLGDAGRRNGALQPHQPCLSAAEGIHERPPQTWGRTNTGVLGSRARRLFLRRVRHSRIGADLLRRPGRAFRRSYQKRQRPGRAARGDRSVLRPRLFQATSRCSGYQHEEYLDTRGRKPADGARHRRRRQADHRRTSTPATAACWPKSG